MKKTAITFFIVCMAFIAKSQNYITRNGSISFYSHTALEDIRAQNNEAVSVLNAATGDIEFKIAIKSFHFPKTSMEEHFNDENYMDSDKFPKAGFKGKITNISAINFLKDGIYPITISGNLTIKNITKNIVQQGTITVKNGAVNGVSNFKINRKDYNVLGQSFVQSKIADEIEITVNCTYDKQ